MRRFRSLILVSVIAIFAAACSDDSGTDSDSSVTKKDSGPAKPDSAPPPTEMTCNNDCNDFVVNKVTVPDATTASKVGWDYDGDGAADNALGAILGGLAGMASGSFDIQGAVDDGINSGKALVLMRMQADDFQNDDSSIIQGWLGAQTACCSNPDDSAACATEAASGCFGGSQTFEVDTASPQKALFGGKITGGKMLFGPSDFKFSLSFGTQTITLDLKAVYFQGDVSADGKSITNGILAGAVTQENLNNDLLPTIATTLDDTIKDATTTADVKNVITSLFDADTDGNITVDEVKNSTVIKTFLSGDVDVDGDGTKELSVGVGFEAVSATINK